MTGNTDTLSARGADQTPKSKSGATRHYRGARGQGATSSGQLIARGLGWLSLALGTSELLAPGPLARTTGIGKHRTLVRGYGLRECATGVAILASHDPEPWIIARIGGDAVDLLTLAVAKPRTSYERRGRRTATLAVLGATALDVACAAMLMGDKKLRPSGGIDYGDRTGFPRAPGEMRGKGRDIRLGNFPVRQKPATA